MNYKIHLIVESELEEIVCELSTTAGINDLEENLIRKAENAITEYEGRKEYEAEMEAERLAEEMEQEPDEDINPNWHGER